MQANPILKQVIRPTIERAVTDLILPVVERSIKIALTTCEQIVKKVSIWGHDSSFSENHLDGLQF